MAEASSSSNKPASNETATNEAAPTQYEPITDGQADIATTMDGDTMKVELEGRQPMQKIFLWTGSNEKSEGSKSRKTSSSQTTNKPYKPETDGPAECGLPELFPTNEEQIPNETAVEYLEVGLVIGDDPQMMKTTRKGSKKKETLATLARDPTALRVFIPITPFVAEQAKYYVGCRQAAGRCFPRVIDSEVVFFYAEFWHGLPENANKRDRRDHVNARTKYHAATNKVAADRSSAAITFTELEKRTSSNPLAVTRNENYTSTLVLQLYLFLQTNNRDYLKGMRKVMNDAAPDLAASPYTANTGVVAFYDFEEDLSEEDANYVKCELKSAVPDMPDLDAVQVQTVHSVLRNNGWGDRLPYRNLAFFLSFCHTGVQKDFEEDIKNFEVERALQAVALHNKFQHTQASASEEPITKNNYRMLLARLLDNVQSICVYIDESNKALADQHGGILRHGGIKDLMNKLGNGVDVGTLQSLFEQLGVLHAVQHASTNRNAAVELETLQGLIEKLLKAIDDA